MMMQVLLQIVVSFFGTVSFALLFSAPKEDYIPAGVVGSMGWMVYYGLTCAGVGMEGAVFFATVVVVLGARTCAVVYQTPSTLFLIPGIFPLVPGGSVYWTSYYLVRGYTNLAFIRGFDAVRCAFCIVLGIVVVLQLPGSLFKKAALWKRGKDLT